MKKAIGLITLAFVVTLFIPVTALAQSGHSKNPPESGVVNIHERTVLAFDAFGGDYTEVNGKILSISNVENISELDQETLTVCRFVINSRGTPGTGGHFTLLVDGWVIIHMNCVGYARNDVINTIDVHQSDPRYGEGFDIFPEWQQFIFTFIQKGQ